MNKPPPRQKVRFAGGPLDGAEILLDADYHLPEEIIFREPSEVEPIEHVYRLKVELLITLDSLEVATYRHRGFSEVFRLIHSQARRIVLLEDEVAKLQKRLHEPRSRRQTPPGPKELF